LAETRRPSSERHGYQSQSRFRARPGRFLEIGHIRIGPAGNGRIKSRGSSSSRLRPHLYPMKAIRFAWTALAAMLLSATTAAAQIPPAMPAPMVPNLNPGSSLTLPPSTEVPVSPVTPGTLSGSTGPGVGDAAGIYATAPMGVFHHHRHHRHRHPAGLQ